MLKLLVSGIDAFKPGPWNVLWPVKVLEVVVDLGVNDFCAPYHLDVLLRDVSDLEENLKVTNN